MSDPTNTEAVDQIHSSEREIEALDEATRVLLTHSRQALLLDPIAFPTTSCHPAASHNSRWK
jgi:hypothetical protein